MADLTFADSHNMVAYLEKSEDNVDFAEIVDFLNASPIRYALIVSPTIYVSYIEQFWSNTKIKTVNNETQIHAKVNGKTIVITKSSVRRDLHFDDEDGITCLTNTEIFENLQLMGYEKLSDKLTFLKPFFFPQWKYLIHTILQCLSSKSTAWNEFDEIVYEERGDNVERAATTATSLDAEQGSGGSPRRQDTILGDRPAQTRFERLSKQSNDPPLLRVNTLGSEEDKESQEVGKEEKVKNSTTQEEVIQKTQGRYGHDVSTAEVTTASVPIIVDVSAASPTRPVDDSITDDITLAETLMKIKSIKDKGKGIMQEPEKPVKVKGKDQIEYDANVAQRLQAELDEEARLEREREEEASKAANIAEWDDVQAMMDADYELAAKLQAEEQGEISIEERSRLFVELMDKRKKPFAKLRTEEQRRKPPTKT
ncbi:hypothetical protein Tco_0404615 [Tanacetum coccineum]